MTARQRFHTAIRSSRSPCEYFGKTSGDRPIDENRSRSDSADEDHSSPIVPEMLHAFFPESRRFPTARTRYDAWRRAWNLGGYKRYVSFSRMALVGVVLGSMAVAYVVAFWKEVLQMRALLLFNFVFAFSIPIAMVFAFWTPVRRALRHELVLAGVPTCIPCGYDLRGTSSGTCPECGAIVPDPGSLAVLVIEAPVPDDLSPRADGPLPRLARPLGRAVGQIGRRLLSVFHRRARRD